MKKIEISKGIFHIVFPSQYEMNSTFMRPQEFYESNLKGIKGRFFTHEKFMDAYVDKFGTFSYFTDWGGMNIPGNVLYRWYDKFRMEFMFKKERLLIKLLKEQFNDFYNHKTKFYVIATTEECGIQTIKHEISHALFYMYRNYKKEMRFLVDSLKKKDKILKYFELLSYDKKVFEDEIQAYLSTSELDFLKDQFGFDEKIVLPFRKTLEKYLKDLKILTE